MTPSRQTIFQLKNINDGPVSSDYLTARKMVADRGGLPSLAFYGKCLSEGICQAGTGRAWASEVIAHPPPQCRFRKEDMKDPVTGWVLPACYIPDEAVGKARIALLVSPKSIEEMRGRTVVHAESARIIAPPKFGKLDRKTGMPKESGDTTGDRGYLLRHQISIIEKEGGDASALERLKNELLALYNGVLVSFRDITSQIVRPIGVEIGIGNLPSSLHVGSGLPSKKRAVTYSGTGDVPFLPAEDRGELYACTP